jgi:GxxExxY protein
MNLNSITEQIIGCSIEVHKNLGPGLLESTYEECLFYELIHAGIAVVRQQKLPVVYKDISLDCGFRIDLLVEDQIIVELKSVEKLLPIHDAQILTYLKLSNKQIGLLINFNNVILTKGLKRFVNNFPE